MKRWVCPKCGAGKNAPQRPRRTDIRRYCLDCSIKTGHLVERELPSAQRRREATRERTNTKRARERDRARQKWIVTEGEREFDLRAELRYFWRLPSIRELRGRLDQEAFSGGPRVKLPKFTVHRARSWGSSGRANRYRLHVSVGTSTASALAVLLHEAVHSAAPSSWHHNQGFRNYLASACEEAFGVKVNPGTAGGERCRLLDVRVRKAAEAWLQKGADDAETS